MDSDVVDDLYRLTPADFIAGRAAAVSAAKVRGDKATAAELARLKKPTVVAWVVNQLARTHPDDLDALVALGDEIRAATGAGDAAALRALAQRRTRALGQLGAAARSLASEHGQALGADARREVESTLTAAMTDRVSAEQVRSGRLTSALAFAGLGFDEGAVPPERSTERPDRPARTARPSAADSPAHAARPGTSSAASQASGTSRPGRTSPTPPPVPPIRSREVEEAEQALAVARLQHADAQAELDSADLVLAHAIEAERVAAAAHRASVDELTEARADAEDARRDRVATERAVAQAVSALDRAIARQK